MTWRRRERDHALYVRRGKPMSRWAINAPALLIGVVLFMFGMAIAASIVHVWISSARKAEACEAQCVALDAAMASPGPWGCHCLLKIGPHVITGSAEFLGSPEAGPAIAQVLERVHEGLPHGEIVLDPASDSNWTWPAEEEETHR